MYERTNADLFMLEAILIENITFPNDDLDGKLCSCILCGTVLKLLKMAVSVRALLDTVVQALPEVGNLGLLFFLLFYIFAALGVELFGRVGKESIPIRHP